MHTGAGGKRVSCFFWYEVKRLQSQGTISNFLFVKNISTRTLFGPKNLTFFLADGGVQSSYLRPKPDGEWRLLDWERSQPWPAQSPSWILDILEGELTILLLCEITATLYPRRMSPPTLHLTMPRKQPAGTKSKALKALDFSATKLFCVNWVSFRG